jgi:hypothetical protein
MYGDAGSDISDSEPTTSTHPKKKPKLGLLAGIMKKRMMVKGGSPVNRGAFRGGAVKKGRPFGGKGMSMHARGAGKGFSLPHEEKLQLLNLQVCIFVDEYTHLIVILVW